MPSSENGHRRLVDHRRYVAATELPDPDLAERDRRQRHLAIGGRGAAAEAQLTGPQTEPRGVGRRQHDVRGAGVDHELDRHPVDRASTRYCPRASRVEGDTVPSVGRSEPAAAAGQPVTGGTDGSRLTPDSISAAIRNRRTRETFITVLVRR